MARSRTRIIRSARLLEDRKRASVILTMMMAVNDAGLASNALEQWTETTERRKKVRFQSGRMYFSRISMAHCFEVFKIIDEIEASSKLREAVQDRDSETRRSYTKLRAFRQSNDHKLDYGDSALNCFKLTSRGLSEAKCRPWRRRAPRQASCR